MYTNAEPKEPHSLFRENSWGLKTCLILMFLLATLLRLDDIKVPGHLLDREYTSAIFARAYYYANSNDIQDWQRDIAITIKDQQPVLEPPVLEYMVSWIYRIAGREEISYSRYLTNSFWLIGGIFLFLIAKKLLSVDEAVVATGYFLFVPMGIIVSRSFQPDSMMMMLFLISLYVLVLYFEEPSTKLLIGAGILTGITLLLRPLVIFAIFCSFLALSYHGNRNWKRIIDMPLMAFSVISLLPSTLYYGYGIIFGGFMRWKVSTSFMPYLLTRKDFWTGWFDIAANVAELTPLILAIVGFFLLRNSKVQYLIVGLAAAFLLFSVTFTYHIHTHLYYHIQLFPIIGLCMAPVIVEITKRLWHLPGRIWLAPVLAVLVISLYFSRHEVVSSIYQYHMEDPETAQEIGDLVQHSPNTVFVANYYGIPLEYYGQLGGASWPVRIEDPFYRRPGETERSVQERIDGLNFVPEYFIITQFAYFENHNQDLKEYLEQQCTLLAQKEQYLIYTSCKMQAGEHYNDFFSQE